MLCRRTDAGSCTHQCSFPLKQNVVYLHYTTGVCNIFLDKAIKNESAPNLCSRLTTQKQISCSFPSCGQMMFFHSWGWLKVLVKFFVCLFVLPHHHCVNYTNHLKLCLKLLFKNWAKTCEEELITVSNIRPQSMWAFDWFTAVYCMCSVFFVCFLCVSFGVSWFCQIDFDSKFFNSYYFYSFLPIFLSDFSLHTCLHLH